jgi:hypothetical protein
MIVLQIEHPVPDYNNWKKASGNDPVNRKQSGVKRYKIFRQAEKGGFFSSPFNYFAGQ